MTLRLQQRRNDNAYLYRSGFRTSSSDQVFNKKWIDGDTVETDLNLSSLSVSSPSVSSCSATLPFARRGSTAVAVVLLLQKVRSYLGICSLCRPQMDSFLTFLTWLTTKEEAAAMVELLLFRIIRGKLLSCLQNHQDRSNSSRLLNEWTKATICSLLACPKHCHGGQKTSSSSLNGYTPPTGWPSNFGREY